MSPKRGHRDNAGACGTGGMAFTWATCSRNEYIDNHGRTRQGPHECGNNSAMPHKHKCAWCGKEHG